MDSHRRLSAVMSSINVLNSDSIRGNHSAKVFLRHRWPRDFGFRQEQALSDTDCCLKYEFTMHTISGSINDDAFAIPSPIPYRVVDQDCRLAAFDIRLTAMQRMTVRRSQSNDL